MAESDDRAQNVGSGRSERQQAADLMSIQPEFYDEETLALVPANCTKQHGYFVPDNAIHCNATATTRSDHA
jgi:hypothetical protein